MESKSVTKYIHFSPYKARLAVDLIRGKSTEEALKILTFSNKKAAKIVGKTLRSAMANAQTNHAMNLEALYVAKAFVDHGPRWNRFMPRSMGRATTITKPTSHITVILKESEEILKRIQAEQVAKQEAKKQKAKKGKIEEAPVAESKTETKKTTTTKSKKTESKDQQE